MPTAPADRARSRGPRLLPGALILRRDAHTLQIGTSPGILVRDRPGLGRVLRLLDGSLTVGRLGALVARDVPEFTDDLPDTLSRLVAAGAVVRPADGDQGASIAVRHDRSTAGFASMLTDALGPAPIDPDLEVLVSAGEPARSTFETLVSADVVHLPVVIDEHRVRIGPLVAPGVTPCLGCLDALLVAGDPGWAVLVPQFERPRLLPSALPLGQLYRAAAEVIHQVDRLRAGERPVTIGHVLSVGTDPHETDLRHVPFARDCPCRLLAA